MYKNILVPVLVNDDHTPTQTILAVKSLADAGAKVTLLHVVEDLPGYASVYVDGTFAEQHQKHAVKKLDELSKDFDGANTVIVHGHAARSILTYAEENACDCIVVYSHKPGVQDYFLGGTAARVVRYAKCAVHVLR